MKRVLNSVKKGYCQRSGVRVKASQLVREPGTNLLVDKEYSDGIYSRAGLDPRDWPARPNPNEGVPRWYAEPNTQDVDAKPLQNNEQVLANKTVPILERQK